tara:strand:+ start:274 stop:585 length:312 start_codon:yes stop_codon:yes gene_type:complete
MTEYEKLLDRMHFEIGSMLLDNGVSRKGLGDINPRPESEILRSNRRTYMNLKIMMLRLEQALYKENSNEEDETEISDRNPRTSDNTKNGHATTRASRLGDFPY